MIALEVDFGAPGFSVEVRHLVHQVQQCSDPDHLVVRYAGSLLATPRHEARFLQELLRGWILETGGSAPVQWRTQGRA